jgi:hypothetical protein
VLVEHEIGDQALQVCIFVLELPHAPHFVRTQVPVALLPDVEGRLTDAEQAADIADGCARLRLPERSSSGRSTSVLRRQLPREHLAGEAEGDDVLLALRGSGGGVR